MTTINGRLLTKPLDNWMNDAVINFEKSSGRTKTQLIES